MVEATAWRAEGLLFENCNCQVLCPAHVSFKQSCTHERCTGHWAVCIERGQFGGTPLDGLCALIVWDAPQRMYEGNWTEALYLDDRATAPQRAALEMLLRGEAGGPWAVLARFVGSWLETRCVPITVATEGRTKRMTIEGFFDTTVKALRGADPGAEVVLENLFNQIHGPTHVLARGSSRHERGGLVIDTAGTHALYSHFSWRGP